jgi:flagellar biosynthesis/type III secretory pathway chaperone
VILGFITEKDPVLAMLEWVAQQIVLIEAEANFDDEKGKHLNHRKTSFSGARVREMDNAARGNLSLRP